MMTTALRWIFVRNGRALTCEVSVNGSQCYDVSVVPHWDVASTAIEAYPSPSKALRRHAELSSSFRDAGWKLVRTADDQAAA